MAAIVAFVLDVLVKPVMEFVVYFKREWARRLIRGS